MNPQLPMNPAYPGTHTAVSHISGSNLIGVSTAPFFIAADQNAYLGPFPIAAFPTAEATTFIVAVLNSAPDTAGRTRPGGTRTDY